MLKISILGMEDGDHAVKASCDSSEIPDMFPEFFGEVSVEGMLRKQGKRLILNAKASCMSKLLCDVSGEEFEQRIEAPITQYVRLDSQLFDLQADSDGDEILLRDDEEFIDITEEVRQELAIHLPMKRIAPAYADKTFEELHPDLLEKEEENKDGDDSSPFAALKHLNIQKN